MPTLGIEGWIGPLGSENAFLEFNRASLTSETVTKVLLFEIESDWCLDSLHGLESFLWSINIWVFECTDGDYGQNVKPRFVIKFPLDQFRKTLVPNIKANLGLTVSCCEHDVIVPTSSFISRLLYHILLRDPVWIRFDIDIQDRGVAGRKEENNPNYYEVVAFKGCVESVDPDTSIETYIVEVELLCYRVLEATDADADIDADADGCLLLLPTGEKVKRKDDIVDTQSLLTIGQRRQQEHGFLLYLPQTKSGLDKYCFRAYNIQGNDELVRCEFAENIHTIVVPSNFLVSKRDNTPGRARRNADSYLNDIVTLLKRYGLSPKQFWRRRKQDSYFMSARQMVHGHEQKLEVEYVKDADGYDSLSDSSLSLSLSASDEN
jgi:hypothetical protein